MKEHLDFCSGGAFCSLDDCLCECHVPDDVVPTGAGLDAAARGAWKAWDDAMEHADDDGIVDGEWWAPLVGAMDALYARLSSSDTGGHQHRWVDARNEAVTSGEVCPDCGAIRASHTGGRG